VLAREGGQRQGALAALVGRVDVPRVGSLAMHPVERVVLRRGSARHEDLVLAVEVGEQVGAEEGLVARPGGKGPHLAGMGGDGGPLGRHGGGVEGKAHHVGPGQVGQVVRATPVPQPDGVLQQLGVRAAGSRRGRPSDRLVVGVAVATPRCTEEHVGAVGADRLHEDRHQRLLVSRDVTVREVEAGDPRIRRQQGRRPVQLGPAHLGQPCGRVGG
jgi:hypothetical protein